MTQAEAEFSASKLINIWGTEQVDFSRLEFGLVLGRLHIGIPVSDCITFNMEFIGRSYFLTLTREIEQVTTGRLYCIKDTGVIDSDWLYEVEQQQNYQQFFYEHMNFFRRNCWLSDCCIECTATEKMEWTLYLREKQPLV